MSVAKLNASVGGTCANALKTAIDASGSAGTIKIYSGTMPTDPDTATSSQVLLGILPCNYPCGTVSGKTLTFNTTGMQDSTADATNNAAWARISNNAGNGVIDIDVGVTASGAALQLNTTNIMVNGPIVISSLSIAFP